MYNLISSFSFGVEGRLSMQWKRRSQCNAPILDSLDPFKFPNTFYTAFSAVFGGIRKERSALRFLRVLNQRMNIRKGGGKITKEEILTIRKENIDVTNLSTYNGHHVTPTSRDNRPKGAGTIDQVILIPEKFHAAWHIIFMNLYNEEAVEFLERVFFIARNTPNNVDYCELTEVIESLKGEGSISRV